MGEGKTFGLDSRIYAPKITELRRHQIQETNQAAIIKAVTTCSKMVICVDKSVSVPLDGLDLNSPELAQSKWELELEIGQEAIGMYIHHEDDISPAFMSYTYPKKGQKDPLILKINSDLQVTSRFQGYGFGIGLLTAEDCVLRRAIKLLGFDKTMLHIYTLLFDDTGRRKQYHRREGWSVTVGVLQAGYSNDFGLLVRYLGKSDAELFIERVAIKVYQDVTRGITI